MPRGDKSAYTAKQRRQAEHIEDGYKRRGVPEEEAERRAWATENAMTGGGRKSGSGRGKKINKAPAHGDKPVDPVKLVSVTIEREGPAPKAKGK